MRDLLLRIAKYFTVLVFILLFNPGCDEVQESVIPSVPFSFTIDITLHSEVNIPGNSNYIPGLGYGGVIVYCEQPGVFYAFDATCTFEANKSCLVKNDGVLATCPCCDTQYLLVGGGFPSEGPAKEGLRQYYTSLTNGRLRIYNP